ncbi:MAG: sterol desaturase family protein [Pseudomonadota bacterium]
MDLILAYLPYFAAVYGAMLAVYFAFGTIAERYVAAHPERKIQPEREGLKRKRAEIVASLKALAMSAFLMSAGYFSQTRGWTLAPMDLSIWSFVLWFVIALVIFDAWFYFGHRLLHWGPMYRFHAEHHKSVAPTVWSNDSSGVVDTFIEHSFYFVVWFVFPVPALSIFALRLFDQISGMIGHSGFEFFAGPTSRRPWPMICTTFHDLHHSRFTYNYGNIFSIWDRMLGTTHPRYDDMVKEMESADPAKVKI